MSWLKKKPDPISARARALNAEISALEAQIKKLDAKLHRDTPQLRVRSTALPHGDRVAQASADGVTPSPPPALRAREPIFEDLELHNLNSPGESPTTPEHYNELGLRKFDATTLVARIKQMFR